MYCYCIDKSEIQKKRKKRSGNKNDSHFENFWGYLQVSVLWGLAGMSLLFFTINMGRGPWAPSLDLPIPFSYIGRCHENSFDNLNIKPSI